MSNKKKQFAAIIGANVKKYRKIKDMKQDQLAYLAFDYKKEERNAAQQKIKYIEQGRAVNLSVSELYDLAEALNIKPQKLLEEN